MEHFIEVTPAFDKRHPDPEKNYGIHGAEIRMLARGVIQFLIFSNRFLQHNTEEIVQRAISEFPYISEKHLTKLRNYSGEFEKGKELEQLIEYAKFVRQLELEYFDCLLSPTGADLGYHSPVPMYEGQEPIREIYKSPKIIRDKNGEFADLIPAVYGDPVICPYLPNDVPCYYDGSSLQAQEVLKILVDSGIEKTWEYLDYRYQNQFVEKT